MRAPQRIALALFLLIAPSVQSNIVFAKPLSNDPQEQTEELPSEIATAKTVTPRMLGSYLIDRFKSHPRLKSVRAKDSRTIELKHVDGHAFLINLHNLLDRMNQYPMQRERDVQNMIAMNLRLIDEETPKLTPEQFAASLRLIVKDVNYHRTLTKLFASKSGGRRHLAKPLVGDLVVLVAQDTPDSISFLLSGGGTEYGMTGEAMFTRAMQNMLERMRTLKIEQLGSVMTVDLQDVQKASLIAIPDALASLSAQFGRDLIIAVPARDSLVFGLADDAQAVQSVRHIANRPNQAYPISSQLFHWRWRDRRLDVFRP